MGSTGTPPPRQRHSPSVPVRRYTHTGHYTDAEGGMPSLFQDPTRGRVGGGSPYTARAQGGHTLTNTHKHITQSHHHTIIPHLPLILKNHIYNHIPTHSRLTNHITHSHSHLPNGSQKQTNSPPPARAGVFRPAPHRLPPQRDPRPPLPSDGPTGVAPPRRPSPAPRIPHRSPCRTPVNGQRTVRAGNTQRQRTTGREAYKPVQGPPGGIDRGPALREVASPAAQAGEAINSWP